MALTVYLIRHGRTEWNVAGLLQGFQDSLLIDEGILAARQTGQALADVPFVACYSSLMKRAQDTADYIIGEREIPHFHHKGLNELHFGLWEGQKIAELRHHPAYLTLSQNPADFDGIANQGESMADFYQRVMHGFEQIIARHKDGEHILLVSHGITLTLLTAVLKGLSWQAFRDEKLHDFVQNTAITIATIEPNHRQLVVFNDVEHLKKK
ncbi:histidine phosphatase family protein [Moraxella sp. ZJ142]|uniref:histidine phosphatase family protein n=1 Tax=Moraxella marmotae TaxID=3344520 RepID=UPI0035D4C4AA